MKLSTSLIFLGPTLGYAVGINSFNDGNCNGFQEHYNLNANSKGNLAAPRRTFSITNEQAGCHMKFYTGLNQQPTNNGALTFQTNQAGGCYGVPDGHQFQSFGFYCP